MNDETVKIHVMQDTYVSRPRVVSNGGQVLEEGLVNETPDLLERLYVQGFLDPPLGTDQYKRSKAARRVSNGRSFQCLHAEFSSKGKEPAAAGEEYRFPVTLAGHIGDARDIAETVYTRALQHIGKRHALVLVSVCIHDEAIGFTDREIRRALDAIPHAVETMRRQVLDELDKRM